jgi:glucokinase
MNGYWVIGIDLGGTNLKVGLVDQSGRVLASRMCPTHGEKGPQHFVNSVANLVEALLVQEQLNRTSIVGAGVGSPGPLDLKTGTLLKTANLPWVNVPLRDLMSSRLQAPIVMDNDANAAAYGEFWCGGHRGCRNLVLLTLGTGVGSGVILHGQVLHGHFDNAGELGHMIVAPNGLECPCGQRGCLEAYSSAGALTRRFEHAVQASEQSGATRVPEVDAKTITNFARQGDALCRRLWDEACYYLGIACINIQHAYNPELILLGGGMADAGDFLLNAVRLHVSANQWHLHDDFPRIELARLGSDAGLIGAAGLAWAHLDSRPVPGNNA